MAKKIESAESSTDNPVKKTTEKTFALNILRSNCVKLFGCTSSTFDGAFYGCDADTELSIADADEKIKTWLGKEIN